MESSRLLLSKSIQEIIKCVTTLISSDYNTFAHTKSLYEIIFNQIDSQKQNYISMIQNRNLNLQYVIESVQLIDQVHPDSFFPKTSIQILQNSSSNPFQSNPSIYNINIEHELTGIIVFYCLKQQVIQPDFQLSEKIKKIFEEYLTLTDFDKFYSDFLQVLQDLKSKNQIYCKEIILKCIEKLNGTIFTDLKNQTDEFLAELIYPFPISLYSEFKNKILQIKNQEGKNIGNREMPYKILCDQILDESFNVDSDFEFNSSIYEYSLASIRNLFNYVVSTKGLHKLDFDFEYDEEDMLFFCISFYLIFNYLADNAYLYDLEFEILKQTIEDIEIDNFKNISDFDFQDYINNAKTYIQESYFGR